MELDVFKPSVGSMLPKDGCKNNCFYFGNQLKVLMLDYTAFHSIMYVKYESMYYIESTYISLISNSLGGERKDYDLASKERKILALGALRLVDGGKLEAVVSSDSPCSDEA